MSDSRFEPSVDARLRDVRVPPGFLSRLRRALRAEDAVPASESPAAAGSPTRELSEQALDRVLRSVELPRGLLERVHASVEQEAWDERLREVPVPAHLLSRLRVIPALRQGSPVGRWAVAASLIFLVAGAYLATLVQLTWSLRPQRPLAGGVLRVASDANRSVPASRPLRLQISPLRPEMSPPSLAAPASVAAARRQAEPDEPAGEMEIELAALATELPRGGPADAVLEGFAGARGGTSAGPSGWDAREPSERAEPGAWWSDVLRMRWELLGAPQAVAEDLPELEPSPVLEPRGVEPPEQAAVNRLVMLRYATHPPLFTASHERFQDAAIPLSTNISSWQRTQQLLTENRLPRPGEVRVEDFLAGVGLQFAAPTRDPVALRTAAGPAVFGDERAGLLLLGVQAGTHLPREAGGTHLTVALDTSDSMRWSRRLRRARAALAKLLDHLGPDDRISIVLFDEEVWRVVEQAGPDHADILRLLLEDLRPGGGTNLAAALQQSVSLALEASLDKARSRRLVVITDGGASLPDDTCEALEQLLAEAVGQGLGLRLLDLGDQPSRDPQMTRLAAAGETKVQPVASADEVGWSLLEALTGRSAVVAENVQMRVTWNPEVVEAYRLIGHDANSLAMVDPVNSSITLRHDQSVASLLEVWLRPGDDDLVGWAELQWEPPGEPAGTGTSARRTFRQRISRLQFAPSFAESPLNLQAAALAAETAEILREAPGFRLLGGSPWTGRLGPEQAGRWEMTPKPRDWRTVLRRAEEVSAALARQPEFHRFLETVQRLETARRLRSPP